MLTADTGTHARTNGTAFLYSHLDELTHSVLVQYLERIDAQDLLVQLSRQEAGDIVTRVTEGHLSQVIGTE